jgi:predicted small lipoprotein YifL
MKRSFLFLLTLLALLALSACGQKGDLYLPDPDPQSTQTKDS